jgi:hypothetical protein
LRKVTVHSWKNTWEAWIGRQRKGASGPPPAENICRFLDETIRETSPRAQGKTIPSESHFVTGIYVLSRLLRPRTVTRYTESSNSRSRRRFHKTAFYSVELCLQGSNSMNGLWLVLLTTPEHYARRVLMVWHWPQGKGVGIRPCSGGRHGLLLVWRARTQGRLYLLHRGAVRLRGRAAIHR